MYANLLNHPGTLFGQFERLRREMDKVFSASTAPGSIRSVAPRSFLALNVGRTPTSKEVYAFAPRTDLPRRIAQDPPVSGRAAQCDYGSK